MALSDIIAVMYDGKIVAILDRSEATEQKTWYIDGRRDIREAEKGADINEK